MDTPSFNTVPAQPGEPTLVGKTFGSRAGSYIIDTIIGFICSYAMTAIASFGVGIVYYALGEQFTVRETSFFENFLIGSVTTLAYFFMFEWLYSATPGKLILGMRVVKEDGTPCDARAAIIRSLYRYIDSLFFAMPAYSSMKPPLQQRLGDKSAKTVVVSHDQMAVSLEWWRFFAAAMLYLLVEFGGSVWIVLRQIA